MGSVREADDRFVRGTRTYLAYRKELFKGDQKFTAHRIYMHTLLSCQYGTLDIYHATSPTFNPRTKRDNQ